MDFSKISPTALLTAFVRQFSGLPYTKEIADLTDALATVKKFVSEEQSNSNIFALIEGRYKSLDRVCERFLSNQFLELASGLLPRGAIFSADPAVVFIESDLPAILQQKKDLMAEIIGRRDNLHFLAIDATSELNSSRLTPYFQTDRPVNILCEGLLMYLTFPEKEAVFNNVREILQTFGGVWITPDLTTRTWREGMEKNDPTFQPINQKIASSTSRSLVDYQFDDLPHVEKFAGDLGFKVQRFDMVEVLDDLQCLQAIDLDRDAAKSILQSISTFALTVA
jgi:O-methyltransferase involved in polyketide biosynthesis